MERMTEELRNVKSIGYFILTPFWSQGIGTEVVLQICGIAFREPALQCIIGEVFPEHLASARLLEKNGFRLEDTKVGAVVKGRKERNHRFTPDGFTDEQVDKYKKTFWDYANNKGKVSHCLLMDKDVIEGELDEKSVLVFAATPLFARCSR